VVDDDDEDEPTYDLTTPKQFTPVLAGAIALDFLAEVAENVSGCLGQLRCALVAHNRWRDGISETVREIESLTTAEAFK